MRGYSQMAGSAIKTPRLFFTQPFHARVVFAVVALVLLLQTAPARACESCGCEAAAHAMMRSVIRQEHQLTRQYIAREFQVHRPEFIINWLFKKHFLPAMMMFAEQMTKVGMQQMVITGAFFDADNALKTQQLFQKMQARAHKDYQPSMGMCEIGTMTRSLAAAQRNAEYTSFVMAQRNSMRHRREPFSSTSAGPVTDIPVRLQQFKRRYCDVREHGTGLKALCKDDPATAAGTSAPAETRNRDVDYERVIAHPASLYLDLSNTGGGGGVGSDDKDEEDILALSSNLYGNRTFEYIRPKFFEGPENRPFYLDLRSVMAKRAVAENSFNTIVGMKAKASDDISPKTAGYMKAIFRQLGITDEAEITELLGERPSYYAQMDTLTKKVFQRQSFYTDLYDKPANLSRKEAALRAVSLMQGMDRYKSQLRSEMVLSVILETQLQDMQRELQNRLVRVRPQMGGPR